jgi:hypothetical protein
LRKEDLKLKYLGFSRAKITQAIRRGEAQEELKGISSRGSPGDPLASTRRGGDTSQPAAAV